MFQTYVDFYSKTVNLNFLEQAFLELGSIKTASANPRPLKLFSAALQLSLEIVLLGKNQQGH
jgi:hypothetical protein